MKKKKSIFLGGAATLHVPETFCSSRAGAPRGTGLDLNMRGWDGGFWGGHYKLLSDIQYTTWTPPPPEWLSKWWRGSSSSWDPLLVCLDRWGGSSGVTLIHGNTLFTLGRSIFLLVHWSGEDFCFQKDTIMRNDQLFIVLLDSTNVWFHPCRPYFILYLVKSERFRGGPVPKWFLTCVPPTPHTLYDCMRPFPQYLWTTW